MKLVVLIGLPASGKSYLGRQMIENNKKAVFIDDVSMVGIKELEKVIENGGFSDIIMSDVFLCREKDRQTFVKWISKYDFEIEWIFFENAPEKCLKNIKIRNNNGDVRKVEGLIYFLSKEYKIPCGVIVKKVFDISQKDRSDILLDSR